MRENHLPAVHRGPSAVRQGQPASPSRSHPPVQIHQRGSPEVAGGAAEPDQRMSKHLDGYRRMIRGEPGAIKADPVRGFLDTYGPPGALYGGPEKPARFAQHLRGGGKNARRAGLQFSLDQGQKAVADPIAQEAQVLVRKILAEAPA